MYPYHAYLSFFLSFFLLSHPMERAVSIDCALIIRVAGTLYFERSSVLISSHSFTLAKGLANQKVGANVFILGPRTFSFRA